MSMSRLQLHLSRVLLILSIPISITIIGFVTGAGYFDLDAFNTTWNDEVGYYHMIQTMRQFGPFGTPGMQGYNEQLLGPASYGPYALTTYYPYVLLSFFFNCNDNNLMYGINLAFAVLTCITISYIANTTTLESIIMAIFFIFQFVVSRYAASGLVEMSLVLLCILGSSLCIRAFRSCCNKIGSTHFLVLLVIAILAFAYAGAVRPFLLAFEFVPLATIIACRKTLPALSLACLFVVAIIGIGIALYSFFDFRVSYRAPYFNEFDTVSHPLSLTWFLGANIDCIKYTFESLAIKRWAGIVLISYYAFSVTLLIAAVANCLRAQNKALLLFGFLLAGLAVYETNIIMYDPQHMQRMMLATVIMYAFAIITLLPKQVGASLAAASSILGLVCLILAPTAYELPQANGSSIAADERIRLQDELEKTMPLSEDPWGNTMAKPVENANMQLLFILPASISSNVCDIPYLQKHILDKSLKSQYVCIPLHPHANKDAIRELEASIKESGTLIFEEENHRIYRMR